MNTPTLNQKIFNERNKGRFFLVVYFFLTLILFGLVAISSQGFDDELTNIDLIEQFGTWKTVALMQTEDVHPPGGYVLNGLLFAAFKNWAAVRFISALLYAISLVYLLAYINRQHGHRAVLLAFLVGGIAPASLLWCTSLRWYAYFVPVLMWALVPPDNITGKWFYAKPAVAWVVLAYIGYAAFVVLPTLLCWYVLYSKVRFTEFLKLSILPWAISIAAFLPQGLIFWSVHAQNGSDQSLTITKSLIGTVISLASNQGVFPISAPGVGSALGWCVLIVVIAVKISQKSNPYSGLAAYILGTTTFIATGLAGKFRNLVIITPLQALLTGQAINSIESSRVAKAAVALILWGNLVGIWNIVRHEDTTKNSWHIPTHEIIHYLNSAASKCHTNPVFYTFDSVVARSIEEKQKKWIVSNYYSRFKKVRPEIADCIVVAHTYRGSLTPQQYAQLKHAESKIGGTPDVVMFFGKDKNALIKKRLDPDFPDYQVELHTYRGRLSTAEINEWALSRK